jgi:hypothetical protein
MGQQAFALVVIKGPALAVQLVRDARRSGGRHLPPVLTTWLLATEGETLAAAGDAQGARQAFEQAWRSLPANAVDQELPYLSLDEVHLGR